MSFRIEVNSDTIARLISKETQRRGFFDIHLERDPATNQWTVSGTDWKPLNAMRADHPSALLLVIAEILQQYTDPKVLEKS